MQENDVYISDTQNSVNVEEVVEIAEAIDTSSDTIEMTEALDDTSTSISHTTLSDREIQNQHPITAIEGLRAELDQIEALKTVFSNGRGFAEYHLWYDDNPSAEDRTGYFVSMAPGTDRIQICTSADEDILGVVISDSMAGFVGNQVEDGRDYRYGLVCLIGSAEVRCMKGVAKGDYVVPNALGIAQKTSADVKTSTPYHETITIIDEDTETGFYTLNHAPDINDLQVYLLNSDGTYESEITVITPQNDGETVMPEGKNIVVDHNTITVVLGDTGYKVGDKLKFIYTYEADSGAGYKVISASVNKGTNTAIISLVPNGNALSRIKDEVNNLTDAVSVISTNVVIAVNTANEALSLGSNGTLTSETIEKLGKVEDIEDIANDAKNMAITSRDYAYEAQRNAEQAAKDAEVLRDEAVATANAAWSGYEQLEGKFIGIEMDVDKYSVGEYSQAYNLTYQQTKDCLVKYFVYVPTTEHTEEYVDVSGNVVQDFDLGYSYTWNGTLWESTHDVTIGGDGSVITTYWYTGGSDILDAKGNVVYDKERLYMRQADVWVPVASLQENSLARVVSAVALTANSANISVADVKGDVAEIDARVDGTESEIQILNTWKTNTTSALATVQQKADNNAASITSLASFAYEVNSDGEKLGTDTPTGVFYAIKPEWNEANESWGFDANYTTQSTPGYHDEINYCYALNSANQKTYYVYEVIDNVWWRFEVGLSKSVAAIQKQADTNGASVAVVVENGAIKATPIVASINQLGETDLKLNADKIDFTAGDYTISADHLDIDVSGDIDLTGYVTFTNLETVGETVIDGGNIKTNTITSQQLATDAIQSNNYETTTLDTFTDAGTFIDLANGGIYSKQFYIDSEGNAHFNGDLGAETVETITLDASQITTGILNASRYEYTEGETYTTSGMGIDLNNGCIRSTNFAIEADGTAHYTGDLSASQITTGSIQSVNYQPGGYLNAYAASGMAIDLDNAVISTPSFKLTDKGYAFFKGTIDSSAIIAANIKASQVQTGILSSTGYEYADNDTYTTKGTFFDLDNGNIRSTNFAIEDGNAFLKGTVVANKGVIANWDITHSFIGTEEAGIYTDDTASYHTLASDGTSSDVTASLRFYAGALKGKDQTAIFDLIGTWSSSNVIKARATVLCRDGRYEEFELSTIQYLSDSGSWGSLSASDFATVEQLTWARIEESDYYEVQYARELNETGITKLTSANASTIKIQFSCYITEPAFRVLDDGAVFAQTANLNALTVQTANLNAMTAQEADCTSMTVQELNAQTLKCYHITSCETNGNGWGGLTGYVVFQCHGPLLNEYTYINLRFVNGILVTSTSSTTAPSSDTIITTIDINNVV